MRGPQVIDDTDGEEKEAAGTFAAQLPIMTTSKVIIGSLIILLVLPFLETCDEDAGRLTGLQHLQVGGSLIGHGGLDLPHVFPLCHRHCLLFKRWTKVLVLMV